MCVYWCVDEMPMIGEAKFVVFRTKIPRTYSWAFDLCPKLFSIGVRNFRKHRLRTILQLSVRRSWVSLIYFKTFLEVCSRQRKYWYFGSLTWKQCHRIHSEMFPCNLRKFDWFEWSRRLVIIFVLWHSQVFRHLKLPNARLFQWYFGFIPWHVLLNPIFLVIIVKWKSSSSFRQKFLWLRRFFSFEDLCYL